MTSLTWAVEGVHTEGGLPAHALLCAGLPASKAFVGAHPANLVAGCDLWMSSVSMT
jgi:hypothetical protein